MEGKAGWCNKLGCKIIRHFKFGLSPCLFVCFFFCFSECPLKMMDDAFYFILKALFVLKIFKFFSWVLWSCRKTGWSEKLNKFQNLFISKSQPVKQTVTINTLLDITKSKNNKTIKFGLLIEYNVTNIFMLKLRRKWGRKTSSRHLFVFRKSFMGTKSKWSTP